MSRVDAIICGGGAIGLAIGRCLSSIGLEVLVVEKLKKYGLGISSRSSEVFIILIMIK